MPRPLRNAPGGIVYHVLNRGNDRRRVFEVDGDYAAFERILAETQARIPMRILAWCLMPNHWHLVLWPQFDGTLSQFMRLATLTHTHRWHAHRASTGTGHLYQGRYKAFAVQDDEHFLIVCRYVERNALAGRLVERAEHWRWCSLWRTHCAPSAQSPRIDACVGHRTATRPGSSAPSSASGWSRLCGRADVREKGVRTLLEIL